jgi:uncharacterized membrane protein YesL
MEIWSILVFGMLVGMQHALEADHLAAVAALSAKKSSRRQLVLRGAYWGLGHTFSLFAICGAAILLGLAITERVEATLEFFVGVMIVLLGAHVLLTLFRRRIHFHVHQHGGERHIHAHAHAGEPAGHQASRHAHAHPKRGFIKALAVGLVHGAAGSGALLVLIVAVSQSTAWALFYVLSFGFGSILGMATLSFIASYPLKLLEKGTGWLDTAVMAAIGGFAVLIGGGLVIESAGALGF